CPYADGRRHDDVFIWRPARFDPRHFTSAVRDGARSPVLQRPCQSFSAHSRAHSIAGGARNLVERPGAVWFLRPINGCCGFRADAFLRVRRRISFHLSPSPTGHAPALSNLGISGGADRVSSGHYLAVRSNSLGCETGNERDNSVVISWS